jgi:hypothetical protein
MTPIDLNGTTVEPSGTWCATGASAAAPAAAGVRANAPTARALSSARARADMREAYPDKERLNRSVAVGLVTAARSCRSDHANDVVAVETPCLTSADAGSTRCARRPGAGWRSVANVLSQRTGIPTLFVRKPAKTYGTRRLAEGGELAGRRLLVVEDVVTSGANPLARLLVCRRSSSVATTAACVPSWLEAEAAGPASRASRRLKIRGGGSLVSAAAARHYWCGGKIRDAPPPGSPSEWSLRSSLA